MIPKTATPARMAQNISVFDITLTDEDLVAIDALDQGEPGRRGPHTDTFAWIPAHPSPKP